jgi:hypothetical protein
MYEPTVEVLREHGLGGGGTKTKRYMRVVMLRFLILQRQDWPRMSRSASPATQVTQPRREKNTMTHQIIKEMRTERRWVALPVPGSAGTPTFARSALWWWS